MLNKPYLLRTTYAHSFRDIFTVLILFMFTYVWAEETSLKVPSIITGQWEMLPSEQVKAIIGDFNRMLKEKQLNVTIDESSIRRLNLEFYENGVLYEMAAGIKSVVQNDQTVGISGGLSFLVSDSGVWILDGSTLSQEGLNTGMGLNLDSDKDALNYLLLFVNALASKSGDFQLIASPEELSFDYKTDNIKPFPPADEAKIRGFVKPVKVQKVDDKTWLIRITMLYQRVLFDTTFSVSADGHISILKDTPLTRQLPFEHVIWESGVRLSSSDRAWRHRAMKVTLEYTEKLYQERAELDQRHLEVLRNMQKSALDILAFRLEERMQQYANDLKKP